MSSNFIHIDINSYFASLLQQENPFLRGKPVGVIKDVGRTCIIAASKEAKKYGVKTGSNVKEAKKLIPSIILIPAKFDLYLHCTKKLKQIFESITPDAEIFSLDEAFIPLDNCVYLYSDPYKLALNIQEKIKKELGEWVTCNIGIGENRLLAKTAGEIAPKGSILKIVDEINPADIPKEKGFLIMTKDELLKTAKFSDVCGIGFRLEERLKPFGVEHPYQINSLSDEVLEKYFGPFYSQALRRIGKGEESYILNRPENAHMKGVGRTITGYKLCSSEDAIKRVLYNLTEEVTYKVRKMDMAGRLIFVFLTGSNGGGEKSWHGHKTLKHYIRHTNEMFNILYHSLYKKWKRNFSVIRFGVGLSLLKPLKETPYPLLTEWYKNERLYKAMDKISDKFGLFTIRSGVLKEEEIIRPEVTGFLGDKKYQLDYN
ncbi:hypothetical protein A2716_04455 [candidate division WWE3 bacterium RIFCSPHIGHO2_01_FULL_40_23]|uniref:UmuC domain-containing protein n=1 Tax=candidate division WWE3 bacterium RIFCSPLOWO2_01_FULL_41_18 TaxID=1802625 RepID=A0A1F4VD76_UNCKA|nr:MAG: hypothetical protein A2716_04455 [candidate division WWE3 bacterium RIFCSPHIGHO2_01_FULL_40_23]OGC55125.1 MAG: hypothetical protein A3A78_04065 [candidate division WWE3 bacterium RIFCSPLOWO2_01_FULL_41_18]